MLKISILGYGKMGHLVKELLPEAGFLLTEVIDPYNPTACKKITSEVIKNTDVFIDFSSPQAIKENLELLLPNKAKVVVGTTGWERDFGAIKELCLHHEAGIVYGANFSLGMNIFFQIVEKAAELMSTFDSYDIWGFEAHHNAKADAPSGTAKKIAEIIFRHIPRKKELLCSFSQGKIKPEQLSFGVIRSGAMTGTHKIGFESEADSIELTHTAYNRKGFALGALKAAKWLQDKQGLYNFADIFQELV